MCVWGWGFILLLNSLVMKIDIMFQCSDVSGLHVKQKQEESKAINTIFLKLHVMLFVLTFLFN